MFWLPLKFMPIGNGKGMIVIITGFERNEKARVDKHHELKLEPISKLKTFMIMFPGRHAGEGQHPVSNCFDWILAYARMTVFL